MVVLVLICTIIVSFVLMIFNTLLSFIVSCLVTFVFVSVMNKKYIGTILGKKDVFMFLSEILLVSGSVFMSAFFWIWANSLGELLLYGIALVPFISGLILLYDNNQAYWLGYVK